MAQISSVTLTDQWPWRSPQQFETFLNLTFWTIKHVLATMCLHANRMCNFNCRTEVQGLLKVTVSHVRWKTVENSDSVRPILQSSERKWRTACRIASSPMTLSDFQGHVLFAGFSKCDFFRTATQHVRRFQLRQRVARSLRGINWASCLSTHSTDRATPLYSWKYAALPIITVTYLLKSVLKWCDYHKTV